MGKLRSNGNATVAQEGGLRGAGLVSRTHKNYGMLRDRGGRFELFEFARERAAAHLKALAALYSWHSSSMSAS